MNILFITIAEMENIENHTIYCDLLRCFRNHNHTVYTISPYEKRTGKRTEYINMNGVHMLHVATGNITKAENIIEKGLATVSIESVFIRNIKKYFADVKFDLVLYSTPPITFCKAIQYVKNRDGAKSYLMLKDIFPQNAVDLGMMKKTGLAGLLYRYFRNKEKKLYAVSDRIGCMSQANVDYLLKHNPEITPDKVEVCPNAAEVQDFALSLNEKKTMRDKYGIPTDKKVFIYGGNLGKPQCIPFIIECLRTCKNEKVFFLLVGDGTEYEKLEYFVKTEKPSNVKLMKRLPKEYYDKMIAACDVGLIFLDYRFTIPNFPSRLLSYMQAGIPVLACTDKNTDIGKVITEGGFGWWCESNDASGFNNTVNSIIDMEFSAKVKDKEMKILKEQYSVEKIYMTIISHYN